MNLPKSMVGIHRELAENRRERAAARCTVAVHGIAKSGKPYKREDARFQTDAEASAYITNIEALNPGHKWVKVAL